MNSHAENFICSRSALTLGGGGYDEKEVTGGQSWRLHKDTRHSDQAPIAVGEIPVFLQVDSLVSSRRGFATVQIFRSTCIKGRHAASADAQM